MAELTRASEGIGAGFPPLSGLRLRNGDFAKRIQQHAKGFKFATAHSEV
jgi:hypothetical protein